MTREVTGWTGIPLFPRHKVLRARWAVTRGANGIAMLVDRRVGAPRSTHLAQPRRATGAPLSFCRTASRASRSAIVQ